MVAVLFVFMLLHQTDRLMIGPLQDTIERQFSIDDQQWGLINSGALLVGTVLYPIWGYLYDRYARAKLLALASLIWGATTWISAIAPNYRTFLVTRASTGIDDSAYPGLYSLVADYFGPFLRGRIYGLLQLAQPLGYLVGMLMALIVAPLIGGWRQAFYVTGSLGLVVAMLIYFGVKELPRGQAEPEFDGLEEIGQFRFSWREAVEIFRKKTMWFVFLQGFAGVFPWNVITFFFFGYLMADRGYDNDAVLLTMAPVIVVLAGGYFLGGVAGDWLFKRTHKGRIIVSMLGVLLGALFLFLAMRTPADRRSIFFLWMLLTAIFMPLSSPNVVAHSLRCGGSRGAFHSAGGGVLRREYWCCLRAAAGRLPFSALRQGERHPLDLHRGLAALLWLLPGCPVYCRWRRAATAFPDGRPGHGPAALARLLRRSASQGALVGRLRKLKLKRSKVTWRKPFPPL